MPFAPVNGQNIHYSDTGGSGPAVILGHGFLMDLNMFNAQVDALSDKYRIVTWDERGFGQTEFDDKPFTYWDSANDCLELMTYLGIKKAVVGGMSQGGFLAMRAAIAAPERVSALILLNTEAGVPNAEILSEFREMMDTWLTQGPSDEVLQSLAEIIINEPGINEKWISKWRERPKELIRHPADCLLDRDDIIPKLGEITCPAIIVHGTEDAAISADSVETMYNGLQNADDIVWVEGAAHAANITHADTVNASLRSFLDRVT